MEIDAPFPQDSDGQHGIGRWIEAVSAAVALVIVGAGVHIVLRDTTPARSGAMPAEAADEQRVESRAAPVRLDYDVAHPRGQAWILEDSPDTVVRSEDEPPASVHMYIIGSDVDDSVIQSALIDADFHRATFVLPATTVVDLRGRPTVVPASVPATVSSGAELTCDSGSPSHGRGWTFTPDAEILAARPIGGMAELYRDRACRAGNQRAEAHYAPLQG